MSFNRGWCRVVQANEESILVLSDDLNDEIWIPRDSIDPTCEIDPFESGVEDAGELLVQEWFAETRGWE